MLHEVDAALRTFLSHRVGEQATVSVEDPGEGGRPEEPGPAVVLFLYDIREDMRGRDAEWHDIRDAQSRVVARQAPFRRYHLSYLVTSRGTDTTTGHRLLSEVLSAVVVAQEVLPADCLTGSLADCGLPVRLSAACALAPPWDLWQALRIPPRSCLDLLVTAPLLPQLTTDLAAPAERLVLDARRTDPSSAGALAPNPGADKRWTTTRIRERPRGDS